MRLDELNALSEESAVAELQRCCGSRRWARAMASARPFASFDALVGMADGIWPALAPADWLEAFAAHPRIGETTGSDRPDEPNSTGRAKALAEPNDRQGCAAEWSAREQAGVARADDALRARLAEANREYQARFGYIFIVCATGKSADEMLAILERRLENDPGEELRTAAEEQRKITRLRLVKLLDT